MVEGRDAGTGAGRFGGHRFLIWSGLDAWRVEVAQVELSADGMSASGTQIGLDPVRYRLDYRLSAPEQFITRRLDVEATGSGWTRRLELRRDGGGGWVCEAEDDGRVDLAPAGGDAEQVQGAFDCDLGLSPLTNTMPVRRHRLDREHGAVDFLMAWVSVPDLGLHPSQQRYEHVRSDDRGSVVRYIGTHRSFVGELTLDPDGLVVRYPELARRLDESSTEQKRDADEVA